MHEGYFTSPNTQGYFGPVMMHEGGYFALPSEYEENSQNSFSPVCNLSQGSPKRINEWLTLFKKWLPGYLHAVYELRLKPGEVYPLCHLKGDFRVISGLKIDHVSLGYPKLSHFIKSVPELCRMGILIQRNGRARHVFLLPVRPCERTVTTKPVCTLAGNGDKLTFDEYVTKLMSNSVVTPTFFRPYATEG